MQVRICTRMGVEMKSTDFRSKDYYSNIRKAVTAGYFMQVSLPSTCLNSAVANRYAIILSPPSFHL